MALKVHELEFDSSLFGYKVGAIALVDRSIHEIQQLKEICYRGRYRLIYLFPKNSLAEQNLLKDDNFLKMPSKVTYIKNNINPASRDNNKVKLYTRNYVSPSLLDLVYSSGHYSRFKLDPNFVNGEYEKLYSLWISKSITHEVASHIFVYEINDAEVGVLTCNIKDDKCIIGLLAVNEKYRNQGIAKHLFDYLFKQIENINISKVFVDTQIENKIACKFYESLGFQIESILPTYHYWPNYYKNSTL